MKTGEFLAVDIQMNGRYVESLSFPQGDAAVVET